MGKALQIRVSAVTWDEDLVHKLWPRLSALALSVPLKQEKRGVLEMIYALANGIKFMDWPSAKIDALKPDIERAEDMVRRIENALGNWKPSEAHSLSEELENLLDRLETKCR